ADLAVRELPGFEVRVIDTGGIAMAHGLAVLDAAKGAAAGGSLDETAATACRAAAGANLVGVLKTTRYLARSGRVPWIVHFVTSLLRIKPIIAASAGKTRAVGRVRTMTKGMERMIDFVRRNTASDRPLRVAVMHADASGQAQVLAERVRDTLAPVELLITEFTGVMAVHTGPGFLDLPGKPRNRLVSPKASLCAGLRFSPATWSRSKLHFANFPLRRKTRLLSSSAAFPEAVSRTSRGRSPGAIRSPCSRATPSAKPSLSGPRTHNGRAQGCSPSATHCLNGSCCAAFLSCSTPRTSKRYTEGPSTTSLSAPAPACWSSRCVPQRTWSGAVWRAGWRPGTRSTAPTPHWKCTR